MRRIAPAALALTLALAAASCSYSPSPAQFPTHLKTLAVPILKNETTEPNIEQEVTQAIVDRFVQDNKLRVVDEAQADLIISGSVVRYTNSVFGFNAWFGFAACAAMIVVAKALAVLLKRPDSYYGQRDD